MKIGIDIDDCLAQTLEYYCSVGSTLLGRELNKQQLVHSSGKMEAQGMVTADEFTKINDALVEMRFFKLLEPYHSGAQALQKLQKKGHEIFLITSRDNYKEAKDDTIEWLIKWKIPYTDVFFSQKKNEIITQENIQFFVDDRESYIEQAIQAGASGILYAQPWNSSTKFHGKVPRFEAWNEIVSYINLV